MFNYDDTNFAIAFGLADSKLRESKKKNFAKQARYFKFEAETYSRLPGSEDGVWKTLPVHLCVEDDYQYFAEFLDLNTEGLEGYWDQLFCLDDPKSI